MVSEIAERCPSHSGNQRSAGVLRRIFRFNNQNVDTFESRSYDSEMAKLTVNGTDLEVKLSPWEKLGAMRGDVSVPLGAVREVRLSGEPWHELRGIRAPGTGIPGVIALGTRRGDGLRDFAAVYGRRPAVVVETNGDPFDRLVVSCSDAADHVERIASARRGGNR